MSEEVVKYKAFGKEHRRAFAALWREYTLLTRAVTCGLIAAAGFNIALAVGGETLCLFGPLCWMPAGLQRAIASDGMTTLLTLAIALAVGIHLKARAARGALDGSEHYDIGRALAYGYFINFLVPALLLVRAESDKSVAQGGKRHTLWVVFPSHVSQLETFKKDVAPLIRDRTTERKLEAAHRTGAGVIRRSLLVMSRLPGAAQDEAQGDVFFDFPTTLYTMHDYYLMWNEWQKEHRKTEIDATVLREDEERQLNAFFVQLDRLFLSSPLVLETVKALGVTGQDDLADLHGYFERVTPAALRAKMGV